MKRPAELYTKLRGSLCQYHDHGLRTGVFIDFNDLGIGLVRPIGAYKAPPPRLKQIALDELIFPVRRTE